MYNSWTDVTWNSADDYYQRKGTTYTGQVAPYTGGTSGNTMIIGAYGTGSIPVVTSYSSQPLYINNRNYVTVQDMRFEGVEQHSGRIIGSFGDFHDVTIQNCEFYTSGTANEVYAFLVYISNSYNIHNFTFQGNDVQNASTGDTTEGVRVYVPGSKTMYDATFSNNTFHDIKGSALRFFAADTANLIANDNRPYGITIEGNTFTNIKFDAVHLQAGIKNVTGHPSYIRNNIAQEIGYPSYGNINAFQLHWIDSVKIYGNTIENVYTSVPDGSGIILDYMSSATAETTYSANNEIYNNLISGCTAGSLSPAIGVWAGKNNIIHHNIVFNSSSGINLSHQYSTGNVFYNNVMYGNTYGSRIQDPSNIGAPTSIWRNNIFSNNTYGIRVVNNSTLPTETNNIFYSNSAVNIIGNTGLDVALHATSVIGNPLFVDPASENFHIQGGSAAVDAGVDVSLNSDYEGNVDYYSSVDAGAYRYQPSKVMGTEKIDIAGGARIYADGKFRDRGVPSGSTADLTITPQGGSFDVYGATDLKPVWMDITIDSWLTSGTYNK
jgi:hypothetical protein